MDLFDRLSLALPRLRLLREEPACGRTLRSASAAPPEVMAFPSSLAELQALLRLSTQEGIRVRLLGAGTNILAPDGGVRGLGHRDERRADRPFHAGCSAYRGHVRVTMARLACFARRQRPDGSGIWPTASPAPSAAASI